MPSEHVITRCRWQSTFDQQDQAAALQDFISQWSRSVLEQELELFFGERCPPRQTWRIDTLELDLGDIAQQDMAEELPRRLRARLHEAFDDLLRRPRSSGGSRGEPNLHVLDREQTLEDSLIGFLRHGSMPWWFQDSRSALQILDQLLAEQPGRVAEIIRDLGRSETIRRRIAWQLGEPRLRRVVQLLEPWQGDIVCTYADQLFVIQTRRQVPHANETGYRHQVWLNILSYLLVDRGTLFNTASFLRSVIGRNAQHYGMEPATLLELMFQAVQTLRPLGTLNLAFVSAIEMIYRQDQVQLSIHAAPDLTPASSPAFVAHSVVVLADAREQLLIDLAQDDGVGIDAWLARQPDRHQALYWLTEQRHVLPIERWLLAQLPTELNPPQETLKQWGKLLISSGCWQGAEALLERHLTKLFWAVSLDARAQRLSAAQLLARMTLSASLRLNISLTKLLAAWRTWLPALPHTQWHEAYSELLQHAQAPPARQAQFAIAEAYAFEQDYAGRYLQHPRLLEIACHLLLQGRAPTWLKPSVALDLTRLLHDLLHARADVLAAVLNAIERQPSARLRLMLSVPFSWVIEALCSIAPPRQPALLLLESFHHWLTNLALPGASRAQREAVLFELLLTRGLAGDWAALEPLPLVDGYVAQLIRECPLNRAALQRAMAPHLEQLPPPLRVVLSSVLQGSATLREVPQHRPVILGNTLKHPAPQDVAMQIDNAGLVILQSFFRPLFARLELTDNVRFVNHEAQRRAVHVLQFLATGLTETPEHYLMLNKLLCGLAMDHPMELSIEITDVEKEVCNGLMAAVIGHWPAIGKTSFDGLRGNWLVRSGVLQHAKDRWDLTVERRAYDVLLARSAFSYSVIKFPWMEQPLYVTWPT